MIDPAQLNQILTNLCVNARDAIKGVGKIAIETRNAAFDTEYCADHAGFIPGKYVLLAISDDGCGMDKKTLDRIFEPFFTTKELGRGTGLGLATVYGIVKQNKGFIYVYSEPGNGTTIKIYLPRQVGPPAGAHTEVPSEIQRGRGETILVVEDEPSILDLTKTILDELGYTVLVASTPTEALRLSGEHRQSIDLLITDVVMPGMSGRDLAEQMHRLCPNLRYLFMSGYTADAITDRGVLDEGVHFIQKPFSIRDLAAKVRMVLNHINTCYFPIIFLASTCAFSIPIEHSTMLY
jgi:two-component system cell cycle sensor histidine kinase/response regulator CckA